MKRAIQVTIDEQLLEAMERDEEVQRDGRSAVFRRALVQYLKKKRRGSIAEAYRRGYAGKGASDLEDWSGEGTWPTE